MRMKACGALARLERMRFEIRAITNGTIDYIQALRLPIHQLSLYRVFGEIEL